MLQLDRVTLAQGGFRLTADWQAQPGARIAVIGPSGGGKSTLLLAIAGFLAPVAGRILWVGQDLTPQPPGQRPVSVMFQDQNLFPHLTVAQNVALALTTRRHPSADQQARVAEALDRVGLAGLGDRRPAQLSGGQQGRAALARVLLRARPILLLDEPFAALGPALRAEMADLVTEVAAETGALTLIVTHDPDEARRLAPLTVLVAQGLAHPPA
ncbi:MAG: ATP-binding cassette domain-containing protein, partial [Rhodobacterales bacterium]|nr:ATP-binding cassette domain-containing protein [Rhodobacterales bacterium]